jgi:hypothetical protein
MLLISMRGMGLMTILLSPNKYCLLTNHLRQQQPACSWSCENDLRLADLRSPSHPSDNSNPALHVRHTPCGLLEKLILLVLDAAEDPICLALRATAHTVHIVLPGLEAVISVQRSRDGANGRNGSQLVLVQAHALAARAVAAAGDLVDGEARHDCIVACIDLRTAQHGSGGCVAVNSSTIRERGEGGDAAYGADKQKTCQVNRHTHAPAMANAHTQNVRGSRGSEQVRCDAHLMHAAVSAAAFVAGKECRNT